MFGKAINGIKYWGQLFLLPIYWLSFLFPRSKSVWLFGSTFGRRFADNPRYFFLYCSQHKDEILIGKKQVRPIWISKDKGIVEFLNSKDYEAYYYHSLKGIWYCLRGGIYFFDNYSKDISFWLSGGAKKFNMWHGVGNKCINYDNEHDKVRHPKNAWEKFKYFPRRLSDEKPSHYILTTSSVISGIFSKAFRIPMEHVVEVGYPRNDVFYKDCKFTNIYTKEEQNIIDVISRWKSDGKKVLGYMPTFRKSEDKFKNVMDLDSFNSFLSENNLVLVCKLHPKSACKSEFEDIEYSNIYNVTANVDINSFLKEIDVLIADYSSVYSDYILMNKPVVAFHYDYEEYMSGTRSAYFDFDEYMPEEKAFTMVELQASILKVLELKDFSEIRREPIHNMFGDIKTNVSELLCRKIVELLKKGD